MARRRRIWLRRCSRRRSAAAAPPGAPLRETTLTRLWPAGQTSLSYRFPRDVSSWCRLDDQTPSLVAFVRFPSASPGARGQITEIANNWTRLFASSAQLCNAYTVCEHVIRPSKKEWRWAAEHLTAAVQGIAISGDRAAVMLTNHNALYLRRTATGEWLIDEFGVGGLPADLRRKLLGPGA